MTQQNIVNNSIASKQQNDNNSSTITVPKFSPIAKNPDPAQNLHYSKTDALFQELYRFFDVSEIVKLPARRAEAILADVAKGEEAVNSQLQGLLHQQLSSRLSSFIGRGALDLNTKGLFLTEILPVPEASLDGIVKESSLRLKAVFNPEAPDDLSAVDWPQFHNGVSASLCVNRKSMLGLDKESLRTWVDYQKTDGLRFDHAGLLFGLGLKGLFDCFTLTDMFNNLNVKFDARIVAVLLGLGVSRIGGRKTGLEDVVLRTLNLHLEFNYEKQEEMQISRVVQSAAMVGIGVYQIGSSQKQLNEKLIAQIATLPFNENNENRECHSLAAGFALGLVNIGSGGRVPLVRDIKLSERLFGYIEGGPYQAKHFELYDEYVREYQASNVKEPRGVVNTRVTAPGSLVALALIYLKSNDSVVSNRIELPNTFHDISQCNPLLTLLKSVAVHLIQWDAMKPTKEFMEKAVPSTIRFLMKSSYSEIVEKFNGNPNLKTLDFHNLSLIYYNIVCGTLLALSIKFAGMTDCGLNSLIIDMIEEVTNLEILDDEFCISMKAHRKLDPYSYCNLLSVLSMALGVAAAGSCDVRSFSVLKSVLKTVKKYENLLEMYGFNLAIQMAIGFVFLGNGAYTFGGSNFEVACLLISVYPVLPTGFNDNRFHLQALRHFYVLAVKENLFNLVDVDTQQPLKLNVQLESFDPQNNIVREKLVTPLLYKSNKTWKRIRVNDDNYYLLDFTFNKDLNAMIGRPRFLYVKRRNLQDFDFGRLDRLLNLPRLIFWEEVKKLIEGSSFIRKVLCSLKEDVFWTEEEKSEGAFKEARYLVSCVYQSFKRNKSNFIHIVFNYLLNDPLYTGFRRNKPVDSNYLANAKLIINFNKFLDKITNKQLKTSQNYIWNEDKEISLLSKKIEKFGNNDLLKIRKMFSLYISAEFAEFIVFLLKSGDCDNFEAFGVLMMFLNSKNIKNSVIIRKIKSAIDRSKIQRGKDVVRILLKKSGVCSSKEVLDLIFSE